MKKKKYKRAIEKMREREGKIIDIPSEYLYYLPWEILTIKQRAVNKGCNL